MAKPAITKRAVKGAALTYSELDTNFQNLADATVSMTAGTGGTQVTADLNGNITLVAGTNVTITGDNTAKTVTINSTSAGGNAFGKIAVAGQSDIDADSTTDTLTVSAGTGITLSTNAGTDTLTITNSSPGITNPLTSDLDLGVYKILDNAVATIESPALKIQNPTSPSTNAIQIAPSSGTGGLFSIDCTTDRDLTIRTFDSNVTTAKITLGYDSGLGLGTKDHTQAVLVEDGLLRLNPITTAQRDQITGANGQIIYNSSTNKFQGYAGGSWIDLH